MDHVRSISYSDLKYLLVDLPGDIRRMKDLGDFDRMKRVIELRLKTDLPLPLRRRLELELAMDAQLPDAYPYTEEQAGRIMDENIRDYTKADLDYYRDTDGADWIYLNGEVRFRSNFFSNLIKTRPEIAKRVKDPEWLTYSRANANLLDMTVAKMREKGELAYHYRIKASMSVKPEFYRPGKKIRVQLPVPLETAQMKNVRILRCSPEPTHISAPEYPQRTVCFEGVYPADTVFSVEYEYDNRMRYVNPDPSKAQPSQPRFYTEELPPHIMFKPYIRDLAASIVGDEKNPLMKARKIYDYVTNAPIYSFMPPYFTVEDLTGFMATRLKGDCGVFALFFITLCRAAGVPARWQSGLYTTPLEIGCHDWAQFYVAPYGWLFADCSFGNSAYHQGNQSRREFYFGNLDPFRMVAASEFQHEFDPPMKYLRYDPYDNQDGEAEYEDGPLANDCLNIDQKMVELYEI